MKIAIIGCGNMGKGISQRLSKGNQLFFYDRHEKKSGQLEEAGLGTACKDLQEGLSQAEMVILAVKPQNLEEAAKLIGKEIKKDQILVSLLAGISINTLKRFFPCTVVRMMPNLAVIYGEGVIGLSSDKDLSSDIRESLTRLFQPLGKIHWLPEEKINALTALAGSGPAFIFVIIEAIIDAGIAMGLSVEDAKALSYQMLRGCLELLEKTAKHPGELKWQITSPQGTTIAGIKKMEALGVRGAIIDTFLAAYERANKLSSS